MRRANQWNRWACCAEPVRRDLVHLVVSNPQRDPRNVCGGFVNLNAVELADIHPTLCANV